MPETLHFLPHPNAKGATRPKAASASPASLSPILVFGFLRAFNHGKGARSRLEVARARSDPTNTHLHRATLFQNGIERDNNAAVDLETESLQPSHLHLETLRLATREFDERHQRPMTAGQFGDEDHESALYTLDLDCVDTDCKNTETELKSYDNLLQSGRCSPSRFRQPLPPSRSEIVEHSIEYHDLSSTGSASDISEPNTPTEHYNTARDATGLSGVESWLSHQDGPWAESVKQAPGSRHDQLALGDFMAEQVLGSTWCDF